MPRPYSIPTRYRRSPYHNTKADRQRIFSIVWEWFVTRQHPRCTKSPLAWDNACAYRPRENDHSNGCAIGIFLPTCAPTAVLNFQDSILRLFDRHRDTLSLIFDEDLTSFLRALQESHDAGTTPEQMRTLLRSFAVAESLTIPTPKE